jgi:homoserine kinase
LRVHVRVPATSANLGPGFDALGLALALYNEVTATEAETVTVTIQGEGAGRLSPGAQNVVARGVRQAYEAAGRTFRGVALTCVNRVPPARGLGSSAAAWVGGLVAGNTLLGGPLSRETLLALAARAEGHPDNVAAALFGGLTISCALDDGHVAALALPVPGAVRWVVLVPEATSPTAGALGCVLSGAGPSLLAAVCGDAEVVARAMERALETAGLRGRARALAVDTEGAVVVST